MEPITRGVQLSMGSNSFIQFSSQQDVMHNTVKCSFCSALAYNTFTNDQCAVCQLGTYGAVGTGLEFEVIV
mgnify:CR=1 FL=1